MSVVQSQASCGKILLSFMVAFTVFLKSMPSFSHNCLHLSCCYAFWMSLWPAKSWTLQLSHSAYVRFGFTCLAMAFNFPSWAARHCLDWTSTNSHKNNFLRFYPSHIVQQPAGSLIMCALWYVIFYFKSLLYLLFFK